MSLSANLPAMPEVPKTSQKAMEDQLPDTPDYYPVATNAFLMVSLSETAFKGMSHADLADVARDSEAHGMTLQTLIDDLAATMRLAYLRGYYNGHMDANISRGY